MVEHDFVLDAVFAPLVEQFDVEARCSRGTTLVQARYPVEAR